jgi:hypothetical protein
VSRGQLPLNGFAFVFGTIDLSGIDTSVDLDALRTFMTSVIHHAFREFEGVRLTIFSFGFDSAAARRETGTATVEYRVTVPDTDVGDARNVAQNSNAISDSLTTVSAMTANNDDLPESLKSVSASASTSDVSADASESITGQTSTDNNTDNSTIIIVVVVVVGVLVLATVAALIVVSRRNKGAAISNPLYDANFEQIHEQMARKTLEVTAAAPKATRATRQSSFYSSIPVQSSEA